MRFWTFVKVAIVLLVAFVVAGLAVALNLDPNDHKGRIARYVERETGRTLEFGGPIELDLGWNTQLVLRDVTFGNADWSREPQMAHVGFFEIELAILPLLTGRLDISRLALRDMQLRVEIAADGRSNLEFANGEDTDYDDDSGFEADLEIATLEIADVTLTVLDGRAKTETVATFERISALPSEPGGPLDIAILADMRLTEHLATADLTGQVGSWDDIVNGDRPVPFDLSGTLLGLDIEIDGDVRGPDNPQGFDVDVLISGDSVSTLQPFVREPLPDIGHVSLSANVSGRQDQPVVNLVFLEFSGTRIDGKTSVDLSEDDIDVEFDLRAVLKEQGLQLLAPYIEEPLEQLGSVNGTINIVGDLEELRFEPNALTVSNSKLSGSVTVDVDAGEAGIRYDLILDAEGQTLDVIEPIAGVELPDVEPVHGSMRAVGDIESARVEVVGLQAGKTSVKGQLTIEDIFEEDTDVSYDLEVTTEDQSLDVVRNLFGNDIAELSTIDGEFRATGNLETAKLELFDLALDRVHGSGDVMLDLESDDVIAGYKLDISARQESFEKFQSILNLELPEIGPVDLAAVIDGDLDGMTFRELEFRTATSDLAGSGRAVFDDEAPVVDANLTSETFDFTRLFPDYSPARRPELITRQEAEAETPAAGSGKIFSEDPLPLAFLKAADVDVSLKSGKLITPIGVYTDVDLRVVLEEDVLSVRPLVASYSGSDLKGNLNIDARGDTAIMGVSLRAPNLQIGQLLKDYANLDVFEGRGAVNIALNGKGQSPAAIAASLNGHVRALSANGRMRNEGLGYISGVFSGIGELLKQKKWVTVECFAVDLPIEKGIATSRVGVLNTEVIAVTMSGQIDLDQERYNLKINPSPRGLDLSLAVPVNVRGPLDDPSFRPDSLSTLAKLGTILGSIVFPPAALIGLIEMGGNDHPCVQFGRDTDGQPDATPSAPLDDGRGPGRDNRSTPAGSGVGNEIQNQLGQ